MSAGTTTTRVRSEVLTGRDDGVGPLDDDFSVNELELEHAFPGFTIAWVSRSHGGGALREQYWAIQKDGTDILRIQAFDEDLDAVDIVSNDVANPLGVSIGATFEDVSKALGALRCRNAGDECDWRSDVVVCASAKAPSYTIDFVSPDGADAAEMLADPAKLARATVRAVTWHAPLPGPG